jgi:hypothetical protein
MDTSTPLDVSTAAPVARLRTPAGSNDDHVDEENRAPVTVRPVLPKWSGEKLVYVSPGETLNMLGYQIGLCVQIPVQARLRLSQLAAVRCGTKSLDWQLDSVRCSWLRPISSDS